MPRSLSFFLLCCQVFSTFLIMHPEVCMTSTIRPHPITMTTLAMTLIVSMTITITMTMLLQLRSIVLFFVLYLLLFLLLSLQQADAAASGQGGLGVTSEALRAGVPIITSGILHLGQPHSGENGKCNNNSNSSSSNSDSGLRVWQRITEWKRRWKSP